MPFCSFPCFRPPISFEVVEVCDGGEQNVQNFTSERKAQKAFYSACRRRERFPEPSSTLLLKDKIVIESRDHPNSGSNTSRRSHRVERATSSVYAELRASSLSNTDSRFKK